MKKSHTYFDVYSVASKEVEDIQKDLGHKMTQGKVRDVLMKS